ncbi:hypothetical protein Tco_1218209 [Tanacetum coccineum]
MVLPRIVGKEKKTENLKKEIRLRVLGGKKHRLIFLLAVNEYIMSPLLNLVPSSLADCYEFGLTPSRQYTVSSMWKHIEKAIILSDVGNSHSCNLDKRGIELDSLRCPDDLRTVGYEIDRLREDVLSTQIPNPPLDLDTEESDDDTKVIFDKELFLRERDSTNLECIMLIESPPLPCTDVLGDAKVDIDLSFGEHLDTLSTGDRKIDFNPSDLETIDHVPDPMMFDVPLGNDDSISRSFDVTILNLLFDFDNNNSLIIDNKIFDDDFEDLCSLDPTKSTPIIDEVTLLVTPLPDSKEISLKEVKRFDSFFSLTQSGD